VIKKIVGFLPILAPDMPIGWPIETAPPLGLIFAGQCQAFSG